MQSQHKWENILPNFHCMQTLKKTHNPWHRRRNPTPTRKNSKASPKMPAPRHPKEVKTIPLTSRILQEIRSKICRYLTSTNTPNQKKTWNSNGHPNVKNCFQILKESLQQAPILQYPNPQASYTLYTDASKYAYAGMLTQHSNGTGHPNTYVRDCSMDHN